MHVSMLVINEEYRLHTASSAKHADQMHRKKIHRNARVTGNSAFFPDAWLFYFLASSF